MYAFSSTRLEVINSDLNKVTKSVFCYDIENVIFKYFLSQDPTLQRTRDVICEECHNNEAVFFQV
ncbi:hypothetical protein EON64_02985 [archaeon]|nr:MAG: hypothetical protein EON64_02985 [archaeon]